MLPHEEDSVTGTWGGGPARKPELGEGEERKNTHTKKKKKKKNTAKLEACTIHAVMTAWRNWQLDEQADRMEGQE
jgi:hypothetical protein